MKRFIAALLCLIIAIACTFALSEESSIYDDEKTYLGAWVMYMNSDNTTYVFTLSFFENRNVYLKTLSFDNGVLASDHVSSGQWVAIDSDNIILSLAGKKFAGGINGDGLFVLLDYDTADPFGFFYRCPDLSDMMV